MKLIVGLGNPGPRYADTRHNVGRRIVAAFAEAHGIELRSEAHQGLFGQGRSPRLGLDIALLLPETYMNLSGESVSAALAAFPDLDPAQDLVVVFDDLDLPFARIRVRGGGGAGGQRGLANIIEALGRKDFARLRFGIGRPPAGEPVVDYVLDAFAEAEAAALPGAFERAIEALEVTVRQGVAAAMNRFNSDPEPPDPATIAPAESDVPIVPVENFFTRIWSLFRRSKK